MNAESNPIGNGLIGSMAQSYAPNEGGFSGARSNRRSASASRPRTTVLPVWRFSGARPLLDGASDGWPATNLLFAAVDWDRRECALIDRRMRR
jgi:hypothetical protein